MATPLLVTQRQQKPCKAVILTGLLADATIQADSSLPTTAPTSLLSARLDYPGLPSLILPLVSTHAMCVFISLSNLLQGVW